MLPPDELDAIIAFAWAELARAATDRDSLFRHAQLATKGPHGWPQLRTIILRHTDPARRQVGFHTDARSAKAAEMDAETPVALVAYDRVRSLQLRLWGQAEIHVEDARAAAQWAALYPPLRVPYRAHTGPGRPIDDPEEADPGEAEHNPADADAGFENFAFVVVRVIRLEYLQLRPTGHRRARFEWNGRWHGTWLAP